MDKNESLAFLQSCIDMVNTASDEDVRVFQEIYAKTCGVPLISSECEFVPPVNPDDFCFEMAERFETTISDAELKENTKKIPLNYNFVGRYAGNVQENDDAAFAA